MLGARSTARLGGELGQSTASQVLGLGRTEASAARAERTGAARLGAGGRLPILSPTLSLALRSALLLSTPFSALCSLPPPCAGDERRPTDPLQPFAAPACPAGGGGSTARGEGSRGAGGSGSGAAPSGCAGTPAALGRNHGAVRPGHGSAAASGRWGLRLPLPPASAPRFGKETLGVAEQRPIAFDNHEQAAGWGHKPLCSRGRSAGSHREGLASSPPLGDLGSRHPAQAGGTAAPPPPAPALGSVGRPEPSGPAGERAHRCRLRVQRSLW